MKQIVEIGSYRYISRLRLHCMIASCGSFGQGFHALLLANTVIDLGMVYGSIGAIVAEER